MMLITMHSKVMILVITKHMPASCISPSYSKAVLFKCRTRKKGLVCIRLEWIRLFIQIQMELGEDC